MISNAALLIAFVQYFKSSTVRPSCPYLRSRLIHRTSDGIVPHAYTIVPTRLMPQHISQRTRQDGSRSALAMYAVKPPNKRARPMRCDGLSFVISHTRMAC